MEKASNSLSWFLTIACVVLVHAALASASRGRSLHENKCPLNLDKVAAHELPAFFDISVKIKKGMVTWDGLESKTEFITGYKPQKLNHVISSKIVNVTNHIGTHVDAPGHMDEGLLPTKNVNNMDL